MRKICFLLLFLFLLTFFLANAEELLQPRGWINDFAGVISQEYKDKLTALISELEEGTSAEIGIVNFNYIAPYDEKEYARLLFDNWKPGKKGKDNGVLVFLAIKERRWRIETGYGVEGILPDGLCGEIGRSFMVPYFKEGKYAEGLYQGILKISQVIAKDSKVSLKALEGFEEISAENEIPWNSIAPIIFILFPIGLLIFFNYLYNKRTNGYGGNTGINNRGSWGSAWGGGGFGGGGFGGGGFGGGGGGGGGAGGGF